MYCIGDANGKYMLAHAASAQGISVVENIKGRPNVVNHLAVPAACFTHPEVSFVGITEEKAKEEAEKHKFPLGVSKTSFKANSKALAEGEGDGMAKLIYRKDSGEILGVHIIGLHAADLIHEARRHGDDLCFRLGVHPGGGDRCGSDTWSADPGAPVVNLTVRFPRGRSRTPWRPSRRSRTSGLRCTRTRL